jgi:hypoxanthine phosphoribosyltransferase
MPEKKLILSKQDIAGRVQELGATITRDYAGSNLLVVGVLNGAFIFMADLVREIKLDLQIDFVRLASYGMSTTSSGEVRFSKDVELDIKNRDILIVEDIVDTGNTIFYLHNYLKERGAKSVHTCALIDKKERREVEVAIEYVGFEVKEGFLIGYGLDCREQYRQYGEIYHLEENKVPKV